MDTRTFLEDMLHEGKALLGKASGYADKGAEYAAEKMGASKGSQDHDLYKTIAKGAAGVGAGGSISTDCSRVCRSSGASSNGPDGASSKSSAVSSSGSGSQGASDRASSENG